MKLTRITFGLSLFYSRTTAERASWTSIFFIESFLILCCNFLALLVFWRPRLRSKKSSYFLISLTVADLITGIAAAFAVVVVYERTEKKRLNDFDVVHIWIDIFSGLASLNFLAAIAIERFYVVYWPFKQRLIQNRTYRIFIGGFWLLSLLVPSLTIILKVVYPNDETAQIITGHLMIACGIADISIIALAYVAIWFKIVSSKKNVQRSRYNIETKKLTVTYFIVIMVSVITWTPITVSFVVHFICKSCSESLFPLQFHAIVTFLMYSNSLWNILIYVWRMKDFRKELWKIVCRHRRVSQKYNMRQVSTGNNVNNAAVVGVINVTLQCEIN